LCEKEISDQLFLDRIVLMMEIDDKKIIQQCLNGNKNAFEMLVDKYSKVIFNVAYRMTSNTDDAEDITQSVFIKVYDKLEDYDQKHKFFSWIYRITINETLNFLKASKKFTELDSKMITREKNPEERYVESDMGLHIQVALMRLDPSYRILILLKHFQSCSYKEISESLNIPENKVKSRLFTARQLLKDIMIGTGI